MTLDTSIIYIDKENRFLFLLKKSLILGGVVFLLYALFCLVFIFVSTNETKITNEHFYKKSPHLIATFTGDIGRISYTLKKALEFNESTKIFISGVYSKNSVQTLVNLEEKVLLGSNIDQNRFEIDYYASNTFENVISTLRYLRQNNGIKEIMIISNDYHIMRIKSIFNKLQTPSDKYNIYYFGIKTNYFGWRNIRILSKEVYKLIRTYFFLLLFNSQDQLSPTIPVLPK